MGLVKLYHVGLVKMLTLVGTARLPGDLSAHIVLPLGIPEATNPQKTGMPPEPENLSQLAVNEACINVRRMLNEVKGFPQVQGDDRVSKVITALRDQLVSN